MYRFIIIHVTANVEECTAEHTYHRLLPSLSYPSPSPRRKAPLMQLRSWERCKLPSWVWGAYSSVIVGLYTVREQLTLSDNR